MEQIAEQMMNLHKQSAQKVVALEERLVELQQELETERTQRANLEVEREQMQTKRATWESERKKMQAEHKTWQDERQKLVDEINELKQYADVSLVRSLSKGLEQRQRENEMLKRQLDRFTNNLNAKKTAPVIKAKNKPAPEPFAEPTEENVAAEKPITEPTQASVHESASVPKPADEEPFAEPTQVSDHESTSAHEPADEEPYAEPTQVSVHESTSAHEPTPEEPAIAPPSTPASPTKDDDIEMELVYCELSDNEYFLDLNSNDLYEVVGDPDDGQIGDVLGKLKNIKIRGKNYIWNTHNTVYYNTNDDGEILEEAGVITNGKAKPHKK